MPRTLHPAAAAEAAAAPGNASGCLHRFLLQEREDACAPVVTLVAALAAGKLRTSLVMCCKARLAVQGGAARIETMETRRPGRKGAWVNGRQRCLMTPSLEPGEAAVCRCMTMRTVARLPSCCGMHTGSAPRN